MRKSLVNFLRGFDLGEMDLFFLDYVFPGLKNELIGMSYIAGQGMAVTIFNAFYEYRMTMQQLDSPGCDVIAGEIRDGSYFKKVQPKNKCVRYAFQQEHLEREDNVFLVADLAIHYDLPLDQMSILGLLEKLPPVCQVAYDLNSDKLVYTHAFLVVMGDEHQVREALRAQLPKSVVKV